jgi:hypothetical protein
MRINNNVQEASLNVACSGAVSPLDVAGNQSSCSFTVTVNDTQPPAITCPANITKPTDPNQCTAVVLFAPTVSDNCTNGASATKAATALAPICSRHRVLLSRKGRRPWSAP